MAIEGKLTKFLNKRSWIIFVLFGSMIAVLILAIAAFETRRMLVQFASLLIRLLTTYQQQHI